mmetsp:Transcript_32825/g.49508  ORF Transcript_32825/g.49508 Transcript_32825/m.49508 type:complete len:107 (+) Transcript_32825:1752-2072(+)
MFHGHKECICPSLDDEGLAFTIMHSTKESARGSRNRHTDHEKDASVVKGFGKLPQFCFVLTLLRMQAKREKKFTVGKDPRLDAVNFPFGGPELFPAMIAPWEDVQV